MQVTWKDYSLSSEQLQKLRLAVLAVVSHPKGGNKHILISQQVLTLLKTLQPNARDVADRIKTVKESHQATFVTSQVFLGMLQLLRDRFFPGMSNLKLTATTTFSYEGRTPSQQHTIDDALLGEHESYVCCVMASLLEVEGIANILGRTFLATCMFTSGVVGPSVENLKTVTKLCVGEEAPLWLLSAHMDGVTLVVKHHIKTAGHYLQDLISNSIFDESVSSLYGSNWKETVLVKVLDYLDLVPDVLDMVMVLPENMCYAAIVAASSTTLGGLQISDQIVTRDEVLDFISKFAKTQNMPEIKWIATVLFEQRQCISK